MGLVRSLGICCLNINGIIDEISNEGKQTIINQLGKSVT